MLLMKLNGSCWAFFNTLSAIMYIRTANNPHTPDIPYFTGVGISMYSANKPHNILTKNVMNISRIVWRMEMNGLITIVANPINMPHRL